MSGLLLNPGCCCVPAGTPKTFTGCSGLPLPNYQLRIRSASGGTILETFTTNSSGVASITSTGTKWLESTDGRFSGQSLFLGNATLAMAPGAGAGIGSAYFCLNCCAVPWQKTMTFTSSYFGTATIDQSASSPFQGWTVSPACHGAGCPSTVLVAGGLGGVTAGTCNVGITWHVTGGCASDMSLTGVTCIIVTYVQTSITCPPGGTFSGSASSGPLPSAPCASQILCNSASVWTDTMSASE